MPAHAFLTPAFTANSVRPRLYQIERSEVINRSVCRYGSLLGASVFQVEMQDSVGMQVKMFELTHSRQGGAIGIDV
jgi:hypothetical protein